MPFARPKKRDPVGEAELFDYAVGALGRRMRTVRDLRRLMKLRAHEGDAGERDMDHVVERLIELKYLSDTRFAQDFTRMRKENQGFGRRRIAQDLAGRGVGKELVAQTLGDAFDEADEVALVRAFCERKRLKPPSDGPNRQKETARIMGRLMRAGYSSQAIGKMLRGWKIEVTEAMEAADEAAGYDLPDF